MTKAAALYQFFSSFGIPAYEENTPIAMAEGGNAPTFPYLTYENKTGSFGDNNNVVISFTLWYRSFSQVAANAKSQEIAAAIGRVGVKAYVDGGILIIRKPEGTWAENRGDDSDDTVIRIDHSLILNYYTAN